MIYEYVHEKSGKTIEREFPMSGEIPKEIVVGDKVYRRSYGSLSFHIPFQWGQETGISFDKSPSKKKHVY